MNNAITVVLPCYNERDNVQPIVESILSHSQAAQVRQIIFVDDNSPDGTAEHIKSTLCAQYPQVQCIERIGRSGLSSAVVEGAMAASTDYVAVMDADGQHCIEDLFGMVDMCFDETQSTQPDLVIGSRFKDVAQQETHQGFRQQLSNVGNRLINKVLNQHLTDPLTGFFIVKRALFVPVAPLAQRAGFKVLVDIVYYYRKDSIAIAEKQIQFQERLHGDSKLDSAVMMEFADQFLNYISKGLIPAKFFSFGLVGLSGVLVHVLVAYLANKQFDLSFTHSIIIATVVSIVSNYVLNNLVTFRRNRKSGVKWLWGLFKFMLICSVGAVANVGLAGYLNGTQEPWFLAVMAGVIVGTIFNFVLSKQFVWGS